MEEGLIVLLDTASSVTQHLEVGFAVSVAVVALHGQELVSWIKVNQTKLAPRAVTGMSVSLDLVRPPMIANSVTPNSLVRV